MPGARAVAYEMIGTSPRRRFENRFVALLVVCDALVCAASVVAAYLVRAHLAPALFPPLAHPLSMYLHALPVILALWFVVFATLGMYETRGFLSAISGAVADFRAVSLGALMLAAASFLSHISYSRLMLVGFWAISLVLTWAVRSALAGYRQGALASGKASSRTLVIGCGDLGRLLARRLSHHPFGFHPVGFIALTDAPAEVDGLPVFGRMNDLLRVVREQEIDEVLVADPAIQPGELMEAIREIETLGVEFLLIAGPLQVVTAQAELSGPADLPVVELRNRPFGPWERAAKRLLDVVGALFFLILTAPLMLVIGLIIRRQTGDGALFRQTRVGYKGREFVMYKFRTMQAETDAYAPSPSTPDDERITPVGRWLRKYSLDELPQLLNVLKGEMSIVGPRPEMPFIVAQYEPWQRRRLDAKPGLTGLWQILGRKDLPLRENLEYDFYYIKNRSLLLDLAILLRTIPVVLFGRGAY